MGWFKSLKPRNQECQPPSWNPPHLPRSWRLSNKQCCHLDLLGNCMFPEGSVARRGFRPRPVEDDHIIRACCSNYECQPHCKRCSDRGNLHGHCDYLGGAGDPQWPWTGGLSPGAYNTGQYGPHLVSNKTTAFGQRGELMTAFEQGRELIMAFGR